jgi:putative membrane protein
MWGCDYFPFSSSMGGGFAGGIFYLVFWGLILLVLVLLVIKLFGAQKSRQDGPIKDRYDSMEILNVRYARGEIDQQEFVKMKNTLLQGNRM